VRRGRRSLCGAGARVLRSEVRRSYIANSVLVDRPIYIAGWRPSSGAYERARPQFVVTRPGPMAPIRFFFLEKLLGITIGIFYMFLIILQNYMII
jgi:hypothetical protein